MTATHIVQAGEHLGSIAYGYGFANFSVLWDHPNNASLKAQRKDPLQLAPGDQVFIPDRVQPVYERLTDASHDFQVKIDTMTLSLRFLDHLGEPLKNEPVVVHVEAPDTGSASQGDQQLQTDADGKLTFDVATHVTSGSIEIAGASFPLTIGALDPIGTDTGVAQRLCNLGYLALADDDVDPEQLMLAIQDFQADNDLDLTGEPDDVRSKLEEVYGS